MCGFAGTGTPGCGIIVPMSNKPTIALALGSGGARGLAHLGVIRRLQEAGFEIGYIAGTSIGALVGGVFAAGRMVDYEDWARQLTRGDMLRLLDFSFTRGSLIKGDKVIEAICELVGDPVIESLPVGFTAVATDMREQSEVWLSQGSLFKAIRASTAIPTLMSPLEYQGRLLADGGLVNPLPIAPTMNHPGALTIAVDLNGPRSGTDSAAAPASEPVEPAKNPYTSAIAEFIEKMTPTREDPPPPSGFAEVITQTFEIMQNGIANLKLAAYKPDIVVSIPRDICQFWEFDRAAELIDCGYRCTDAVLGTFERQHPMLEQRGTE